jgi:hypothetical protein
LEHLQILGGVFNTIGVPVSLFPKFAKVGDYKEPLVNCTWANAVLSQRCSRLSDGHPLFWKS